MGASCFERTGVAAADQLSTLPFENDTDVVYYKVWQVRTSGASLIVRFKLLRAHGGRRNQRTVVRSFRLKWVMRERDTFTPPRRPLLQQSKESNAETMTYEEFRKTMRDPFLPQSGCAAPPDPRRRDPETTSVHSAARMRTKGPDARPSLDACMQVPERVLRERLLPQVRLEPGAHLPVPPRLQGDRLRRGARGGGRYI